jgi:membrane protease YdiL (CAAX protease family)
VYWSVRNYWLREHSAGCVAQEILWTAWRLPFAALYLWLFFADARAAGARRSMPWHPLLLGVLALDVVSLLFAGGEPGLDAACRSVFVLTTPVVALREELIYRVVVQSALERVFAAPVAILVSTFVFVAFHIGAQPMTLMSVVSLAAGGVVLGTIYQRTRNLWVVVFLHWLCDVIALFPYSPNINPGWNLLANLLTMFGVMVWWKIDDEKQRRS